MLLKREIQQIAEQKKVPKATIDKDWVLGHFIDAIFSIPECKRDLIFKGGTCLKKCRFNDYRFSEDLDFTAVNPDFVLNKKLLNRIVALVNERTEIPLHIENLEQLLSNNKPTGFKAIVKFWGADHSLNQAPPLHQRWLTSIKIEIISYELIVFAPEIRPIHHGYSDKLSEVTTVGIPCYSIQEVLSEKLRALIQRSYTAPRDYYDIWYLSQNVSELNWSEIVKAFHKKMKFKNLEFTGIDQMINPENDKKLLSAWDSSLAHQIPKGNLPEYGTVREEIKNILEKYFTT